jgi:glycosyltransferase involved in cell wall biosynthesis
MPKTKSQLQIVYLISADISIPSGGMRIIFEHINRLLSRGHDVEIWVPPGGETNKPCFETHAKIKPFDPSLFANPQIIVMSDPVFLPLVSPHRNKGNAYLLLQHDIEMVFTEADIHEHAHLIDDYLDYLKSDKCEVIVVSSWLKDFVSEKYGLKSILVRNGIDQNLFHPDKPILQLDKPLLLTFYDPQIWKGFSDAAYAWLEVKENTPDLQIAIIGRAFPETPNVKGISYGFPFPTIFFNTPEQDKLASIYSSASVFVSAAWSEGFGLPGLEAMACGVPVVTTDSGGVRDYALPDETAVIVPPKNVPAIANGIIKVLSDKKLQVKLKRNGLKKAQEFDCDKSVDALENQFVKSLLKA